MRSPFEPRHPFRGAVRVVAPGVSWTGEAFNISVGGVFVAGGPVPPENLAVILEIDLDDGRVPIKANARVVWVRPAPLGRRPAGCGLQFLAIDAQAQRRISDIVDERHVKPVAGRHVHLRLPGLPVRLRATTREVTRETVVLESEIHWLHLGGAVSTELGPDDIRNGKLRNISVDVGPSGNACLTLSIDISRPSNG